MFTSGATLGLLPNLGPWEYLIFGAVLLLLFGRRLPEVGRSLGQGIVQFKKGLRDIEDEVDKASREDRRPAQFDSARPPVNSAGQDARVSRSEPVESSVGEGGARPAES
ncbi:MAG: twin-arginine translocase TatA/TatE family subunit [Phycisphaerales bacterium]